jgi:hypothetical protein
MPTYDIQTCKKCNTCFLCERNAVINNGGKAGNHNIIVKKNKQPNTISFSENTKRLPFHSSQFKQYIDQEIYA